MSRVYKLLHNTPEIKKGALLTLDCKTNRYKVVNLDEVARYTLKSGSFFSFHRDVVEDSSYWFAELY